MSLKFWLINLGLIVVVVVLAVVLIITREENAPPPDAPVKTIDESLSNFYRKVRNYRDESFVDPAEQYEIEVDLPLQPVNERIANIPSVGASAMSSDGRATRRVFARDLPLSEVTADYAERENLILIWDLPKDFVIKDQFVLEGTVADAVKTITKAIQNSFPEPVTAYTCPDKRTLVVTTVALHRKSNYCFIL